MLGTPAGAAAGAIGNSGNHCQTIANIYISDVAIPVKSAGVRKVAEQL